MDMAIQAEGLCKRYGEVEALSGVDVSVPAGTVLGVLGPNGAGKTTTVRILSTLVKPDAGHATVAGCDVLREPEKVRSRVGLTGQYAAVDERLTGRENLTLIATLYQMGRREARKRADEYLERFELTEAADRVTKGYSGGMRRRLDLAASLIADPAVLFLDEPTTGLDPSSRQLLWTMIREQVDKGVTILLTTQYLEEADQLSDRILVVDKGQVVADGTSAELKRKVGGERLEVSPADEADVSAVVAALTGATSDSPAVDDDGSTVSVELTDGLSSIASAATALRDSGIAVAGFQVRQPSLDDVFIALTGQGEAEVAKEGAEA